MEVQIVNGKGALFEGRRVGQTWNWVTGSLGHHCDPVCDPGLFNFQFSKNAYMLNLHVKC